jgi:hypothetical protein
VGKQSYEVKADMDDFVQPKPFTVKKTKAFNMSDKKDATKQKM